MDKHRTHQRKGRTQNTTHTMNKTTENARNRNDNRNTQNRRTHIYKQRREITHNIINNHTLKTRTMMITTRKNDSCNRTQATQYHMFQTIIATTQNKEPITTRQQETITETSTLRSREKHNNRPREKEEDEEKKKKTCTQQRSQTRKTKHRRGHIEGEQP